MKLENIKITPLPRKPKNKPVPKTGARRFYHNKHRCDYCIEGMLHNNKKRKFEANQQLKDLL